MSKTKKTVYEIIRDRFIEGLEKGNIPWRRPWKGATMAVNWVSEEAYKGINQILLDPGEYATIKQINAAGGKVKKGEKGNIVTFFSVIEKEDEKTKEIEEIRFLKYYYVFEISSQCEGLTSKRKPIKKSPHLRIKAAEKIKRAYRNCPPICPHPSVACYDPRLDKISIPDLEVFDNPEEYYSTLFHEMAHSTAHVKRLNRPVANQYKNEKYSKEELIAELTAAMLCRQTGIERSTVVENSVTYVNYWIKFIRDSSPQMIVRAAREAQKAMDYILGVKVKEA